MTFCKNINFLSKTQYDSLSSPDTDELWAVETPSIIAKYRNGTSGYRIWSDGYCEQWGQKATTGAANTTTWVTFLKNFKNTEYSALATDYATTTNVCYFGCTSFATNGMAIISNAGVGRACRWKVSGYLAEEEY